MTVADAIDVQALLCDSSQFGQDEIRQVEDALAAGQFSDVRQALSSLKQRVGESPMQRDLLAVGVVNYLLARHDEAEFYLGQIEGDPLASYFRGNMFAAMERFDEAAQTYEQASQNGFDPVHCTLLRAGILRQQGRIDEADELLSSIAREGATRAEYSFQKGCILSDRGDTYGAIEYFDRAVDMDPHHTGALFRLAGENNLLGNDEEAIKLYERSLSRPPFYVGALINLGLLYEDNENYKAAAFCFQRVLEIHPNHERAHLYLGDIRATDDMYYDEEAVRRQRELDQIMRIPITDFELSARSRNCLERAGIHTLGDLTMTTEQELLAGKNFGETSLQEIQEILDQKGLRIGQSVQTQTQVTPAFQRDDLSPQERALLESPVTELNLSVRSRKCLARLGIVTVGELVQRSADELMGVRNFGVTSLNEIRASLSERNIKLRND